MIKNYRWDPEFPLGAGSCQTCPFLPPVMSSLWDLSFLIKKSLWHVWFLHPRVPQTSTGLCTLLLSCPRGGIEHPHTWSHQFLRCALKTDQSLLTAVKIYSGSRRCCCSSSCNIWEHELPSWPFSFGFFPSRPMNPAFWVGDWSKVTRGNRCPILYVLGTSVQEHGWSSEAEEAVSPSSFLLGQIQELLA